MTHEEYCNACTAALNMLYRFTYLTIGDQNAACKLVTKACVWGCDQCDHFKDEADFKIHLVRWLFWHSLWSRAKYASAQEAVSEDENLLYLALGSLSRLRRAVLVLRFCSDTSHKMARSISGLPNKLFLRLLTDSLAQTAAVLKHAE